MNRNKQTERKRESRDDKRDYRKNSKKGATKVELSEEAVVADSKRKAINNDANWYFINPEVAAQAGQLSFQSFLGVPGTIGSYTMPTIMTLHMNPSPGNTFPGAPFAQNQTSGFNMSMTKLFNRLSMKSGRNMAYAPQDVGMAVLGIGELLSQVSYVRRLFGTVKWWNVRNRAVPKEILKAMGIDPDDFMKNFSDYRMRANTLILACNQIPILTSSGYLRKCASMYDNIYQDCDANMCQYYIYVPAMTWILDESSDQRGTVAKTTLVVPAHDTNVPTIRTFAKYLEDILEPMINALLTSSTLNLVYADIMNLHKNDDIEVSTIDIIAEDYAVMPIHDVMVLKQIHNTTALDPTVGNTETATTTHANDVVCDPDNNSIKYSPIFQAGAGTTGWPASMADGLRIIDTDTSDPDLEEKVEITRYITSFGSALTTSTGSTYYLYVPVPDHYCAGIMVHTSSVDSTHSFFLKSDYLGAADISTGLNALLSQFDWHPVIYHGNVTTTGIDQDRILGDLNSFTLIDDAYIRRLNSIVYMDLFEFR